MTKEKHLDEHDYYAYAKEVYDFFLAAGFSHEQAAGWVANAQHESSFEPWAIGDNGKAFGLFQLHEDRLMVACYGNKQYPGCGVHLDKNSTVSQALEVTWHELRITEKDALAEIKATTNAFDAGAAIAKYYERVGAFGQHEIRGLDAVKWFNFFKGDSNKAGKYHSEKLEDEHEHKKNSKVLKANTENKNVHNSANTDTADNWNHNVSNPNYYDSEVSKKPDHTTFYGDFGDKKFKHDKKFDDVHVPHPETVNTATSTVSVNTLKHYANASISNTIPHNSNRTRGVDDERKDDFTTDLSDKSEKTKETDAIAVGKTKHEYVSAVNAEKHVASEDLPHDVDEDKKQKHVKHDKELDTEGKETKKEEKRVKKEKAFYSKDDDTSQSNELFATKHDKNLGHEFDNHERVEDHNDDLNTAKMHDVQKDNKELEKKESTPGSHYEKHDFNVKHRGRKKKNDNNNNLSDHFEDKKSDKEEEK